MKKPLDNREDIILMVDAFYDKVIKDEIIGFLFTEIAKINLSDHLPVMYDFWESILFGKALYKGNPMTKHLALNRVEPLLDEHFERWLELWKETIDQYFFGTIAEEAKTKANSIKELMKYKISLDNTLSE